MTVAILGTGPAAMFAATAVKNFTDDFVLYGPNEPSVLRGAQYLHRPIPGLTNDMPDRTVEYVKFGDGEGYSHNVYGKVRDDVSWYKYDEGRHPSWDLRAAYRNAWDEHRREIRVKVLSRDDIIGMTNSHSLVINTVPLTVFATPGVAFEWQDVWIESQEAEDVLADTIVYNGTTEHDWYRFSLLYGWAAWEYGREPKGKDAVLVRKPLRYTGNPVPSSWLCVGRYGAWKKEALTHDAYYQVLDHMMGPV